MLHKLERSPAALKVEVTSAVLVLTVLRVCMSIEQYMVQQVTVQPPSFIWWLAVLLSDRNTPEASTIILWVVSDQSPKYACRFEATNSAVIDMKYHKFSYTKLVLLYKALLGRVVSICSSPALQDYAEHITKQRTELRVCYLQHTPVQLVSWMRYILKSSRRCLWYDVNQITPTGGGGSNNVLGALTNAMQVISELPKPCISYLPVQVLI